MPIFRIFVEKNDEKNFANNVSLVKNDPNLVDFVEKKFKK